MSCVPSMSAYVATHTHQHDDKLTTQINQPIDHSSKAERKSFWEWSTGNLKLIFLGHDGVGLATTDVAQKGEKIDKPEPLDLWSRVRHLSSSSTASNDDQQSAPSSPAVDR